MRAGGLVRGCVLSLLAGLAAVDPAVAGQPDPLCGVSTDAAYAYTLEQPAQVGGGAMYAAARQRRFLDALRGPRGDIVRYTRQGATMRPDETLVDRYEVTYDGLAAPIILYLDAYHYREPMAPRGFICGRSMSLGLPPPDPFLGLEQLDALAASIAAAPGFRAGPVDLGGEPSMGLVVDAFRLKSRRIRTAVAPPIDARGVPAPNATPEPPAPPIGTLVVAFPQTCGGRVVSPSAVTLTGGRGIAIEAATTESGPAAVRARVPGQEVPAGSIAATFAQDALLEQWQVRVTFADPACAASPARESALTYTAAQLVDSPMPVRPGDDKSSTAWVAVQAIIDHQGAFQQVRALGGPPALAKLAEETVRGWKARPARADGAPIAAPVVLQVTFESARP